MALINISVHYCDIKITCVFCIVLLNIVTIKTNASKIELCIFYQKMILEFKLGYCHLLVCISTSFIQVYLVRKYQNNYTGNPQTYTHKHYRAIHSLMKHNVCER